jgi:hypothetical protein
MPEYQQLGILRQVARQLVVACRTAGSAGGRLSTTILVHRVSFMTLLKRTSSSLLEALLADGVIARALQEAPHRPWRSLLACGHKVTSLISITQLTNK